MEEIFIGTSPANRLFLAMRMLFQEQKVVALSFEMEAVGAGRRERWFQPDMSKDAFIAFGGHFLREINPENVQRRVVNRPSDSFHRASQEK